MVDKRQFYEYVQSLLNISVSDSTLFFIEIGIDGLDAEIFMITLKDKYGLDLDLYKPDLYHYSESELLVDKSFSLSNFFTRSVKKKENFSALHLYNVINAKRWFNP